MQSDLGGFDGHGIDTLGDTGRSVQETEVSDVAAIFDWFGQTLLVWACRAVHPVGHDHGGALAMN